MAPVPVLEIRNVSKHFGAVQGADGRELQPARRARSMRFAAKTARASRR